MESLGIDQQFKEMATRLLGAAGAYNSIRVHKAAMNKIKSEEVKLESGRPEEAARACAEPRAVRDGDG